MYKHKELRETEKIIEKNTLTEYRQRKVGEGRQRREREDEEERVRERRNWRQKLNSDGKEGRRKKGDE